MSKEEKSTSASRDAGSGASRTVEGPLRTTTTAVQEKPDVTVTHESSSEDLLAEGTQRMADKQAAKEERIQANLDAAAELNKEG